jgi:Rrf2 family nitric oxide-sensitive transcriptional repressor
MRLTRYTDYALRVLIYLAQHPDRLCAIPEIAGAYAVSQNHLTKVAYDLGKAGFVESERGRFGGVRLARPAAEISVGAVVRAMEGEECLADCDSCVIAAHCSLSVALDDAHEAFLSSLDKVSIAAVMGRRRAPVR